MIVLFLFLRVAFLFALIYAAMVIIEKHVDKNSKFYELYHRKFKRPLDRIQLILKKTQRIDSFTELSMIRNQDLIDHHMKDFPERRPDCYNPLLDFTPEDKIKFCTNEINKLKDEVLRYLNFTGCRVKPNDVYRLELLKREIREMKQLINSNGN